MNKITVANNLVDALVTLAIAVGVVSAIYVFMPMAQVVAHF